MSKHTAAFLSIISLLLLTCFAQADPNKFELESFYNLSPDPAVFKSITSPAISAGGSTLAFYNGNDLYIISDINKITQRKESKDYPQPQPWKLEVKDIPNKDYAPCTSPDIASRQADWCPNDTKLAFTYSNRLYIAENFDYEKKTANIRLVVDLLKRDELKQNPAYKAMKDDQGAICAPRWSPDGKKIAFVRAKYDHPYLACVVDVDSGKETVIADDLACMDNIWQQPWSSDSKQLVYTYNTPAFEKARKADDISIPIKAMISGQGFGNRTISITKSEPKVIQTGLFMAQAAWNPTSDLIALSGMPKSDSKTASSVIDVNLRVYVADKQRTMTAVSRTDPQATAQLAALYAKAKTSQRTTFENLYHKDMTPGQLEKLRQGKLTPSDMAVICMSSSLKSLAKSSSPEISKSINDMLKKPGLSIKDIEQWFANYKSKLSEEEQFIVQVMFSLPAGTWFTPIVCQDGSPIWSSGGRYLAYIREIKPDDEKQLWVYDTMTKKERLLFDARDISDITWTTDDAIALKSKRSLGFERSDGSDSSKSQTSSWAGSTEMWLLKLW